MSHRRAIVLTFAIALVAAPGDGVAGTIVVNAEGTGDYPTIQAAIDAAVTDDVIELASGTYTGDGNRDINFLGKAITVHSQSFDPTMCIIDCEGSELDQHRGFIFNSGELPTSELIGVTVTGGWVTSPSCGGAMICTGNSAPSITNCRFVDSRASCGGLVWCQNSNPVFTDCEFLDGTSDNSGGGLFFTDASPTLTRCLIVGNNGSQDGAFGSNFAAAPILLNCVIAGNTSTNGAVIRATAESMPTLSGCTIFGNTDAGSGTISARQDAAIAIGTSIIAGNGSGPAIACGENGTVEIICSNIFGNTGGDWCRLRSGRGRGGQLLPPIPSSAPRSRSRISTSRFRATRRARRDNHPNGQNCKLIGAKAVGCAKTPVERRSWGSIKAEYEVARPSGTFDRGTVDHAVRLSDLPAPRPARSRSGSRTRSTPSPPQSRARRDH